MKKVTVRFWDLDERNRKINVEEDYEELPEESCNPVDKMGKKGDPGYWVWICDGKPHKSNVKNRMYPTIILPSCIEIWGTEEDARAIGYRKMHSVGRREYRR